uniref:Cation-transporting P-type ATPase N-terminal domain-containing protein n=1 Tax=Plectus sambesii TaxID=2011161 RepID=A0A914WB99_9BILA
MQDIVKGWLKRFGIGDGKEDADPEKHSMEEAANRNLSSTFIEHQLDCDQLAELFSDSQINVENPNISNGLSSQDAADRLKRDGRNALTPPKEISSWKLLVRQFMNMFWVLLIAAGVLSLITYFLDTSVPLNLYVALVLFVIVVVMCLISFFEEKKARNVVRGFQNLLPTSCSVIRDGREHTISAEELVVGDLAFVRNGSRVPADVRLLVTNGLKLETSSITGEAEPIEFTNEAAPSNVGVFESHNVAFNGSFCVDGEGIGIVVRVADRTIIGQIASLTTDQKEHKSSLEVEVAKFVRFISILALTMGAIIFLVGAVVNKFQNLLYVFINGFLVIIVANVPQGLPATLTSQLTIIARRMAKKNVFLKKLDIIEAFGAATIIASDKTGTLTKNVMTVTDLWYNHQYMSGRPDIKQRTLMTKKNVTSVLELYDAPLPDMLAVMTVCNKAAVEATLTKVRKMSVRVKSAQMLWTPPSTASSKDHPLSLKGVPTGRDEPAGTIGHQGSIETSKRKNIRGNPSEVAMLRYAAEMVDIHYLRDLHDIVFEIPFNSKRKWHLVITKKTNGSTSSHDTATYTLMMKGAPEVLIAMCSTLATDSGEIELDEYQKLDFQDAYMHFGNEGRRVIGFVKKTFTAPADTRFTMDEGNYPQSGLCFLGMAAIMDPPRDDTAQAIQDCRQAGVKVFMVTGDHPTTAAAIARQIGLIGHAEKVQRFGRQQISVDVIEADESDYAIVHGESIATLSPKQWDVLLAKRSIVFARTTPEHKLLIVEECQKRGEIVAVTGDGVNDAPALKRADIGVAMGLCGSDVAKQAADIILMDDNFASIVKGIEEGRLLFDNLKKTIAYTLTHLGPEVVPVLMNFALGFPVGLSSLQILSIDLGSELPPSISLAYETSERDIMRKPPRKRNARLVGWSLLAYSYLFAGSIISIGCALAYLSVYWHYGIKTGDLLYSSSDHWIVGAKNFTSSEGRIFVEDEQIRIAAEGCAAFHITLVMSQVFHLWMCTTRRVSFFRHGITSMVSVFAVIIEALLVNLFAYTPGVQYLMGTSAPPSHIWYYCVGTGLCLWIFGEGRKFFIRRYPMNPIVKIFKW